jgi:hypothetical protein
VELPLTLNLDRGGTWIDGSRASSLVEGSRAQVQTWVPANHWAALVAFVPGEGWSIARSIDPESDGHTVSFTGVLETANGLASPGTAAVLVLSRADQAVKPEDLQVFWSDKIDVPTMPNGASFRMTPSSVVFQSSKETDRGFVEDPDVSNDARVQDILDRARIDAIKKFDGIGGLVFTLMPRK